MILSGTIEGDMSNAIAALCCQHGGSFAVEVPEHIIDQPGQISVNTDGVRLIFTFWPDGVRVQ
jgi:hypothetical protein